MYHANNSLARAHNIQFAVNTPAYLKIVEVMGLQGYSNDKFYIASTSRSVIKVWDNLDSFKEFTNNTLSLCQNLYRVIKAELF